MGRWDIRWEDGIPDRHSPAPIWSMPPAGMFILVQSPPPPSAHSGPHSPGPHQAQHPPPGWDVHFDVCLSNKSYLMWVQSHLTCSPPHENNLSHFAWKKFPKSHEATPFPSIRYITSHQLQEMPMHHSYLLNLCHSKMLKRTNCQLKLILGTNSKFKELWQSPKVVSLPGIRHEWY